MKIEKLQTDMIAAMKAKNKIKKEVLADIITLAKNMAIEKKQKDNISEEIVNAAILKAKKTCQEQIDTCPATRVETLADYQTCMAYINEYAPKMMTEDEVRKFVTEELSKLDNPGRGTAMKVIMPQLKGKADGRTANRIIVEVLNNGGK